MDISLQVVFVIKIFVAILEYYTEIILGDCRGGVPPHNDIHLRHCEKIL
ncbi:MAG: hypothetical protein RBS77_04385 [Candidatus Moranbacteria bacterium]|nr:hypothetical protein [Candidatus Moranbacteria bacterium]